MGFLEAADRLGLTVVGWHASTEDWVALRPEDIMLNLAWQGVVGKVVLFHDGSGDPDLTSSALRWLLDACADGGCAPVRLDEFERFLPLPPIQPLSIDRWADVEGW